MNKKNQTADRVVVDLNANIYESEVLRCKRAQCLDANLVGAKRIINGIGAADIGRVDR